MKELLSFPYCDAKSDEANRKTRSSCRQMFSWGRCSLIPLPNSGPLTNILQASIYGKCIVAEYNSVHKDKCLTEFLRLKDCYMVRRLSNFSSFALFKQDIGCCEEEMRGQIRWHILLTRSLSIAKILTRPIVLAYGGIRQKMSCKSLTLRLEWSPLSPL